MQTLKLHTPYGWLLLWVSLPCHMLILCYDNSFSEGAIQFTRYQCDSIMRQSESFYLSLPVPMSKVSAVSWNSLTLFSAWGYRMRPGVPTPIGGTDHSIEIKWYRSTKPQEILVTCQPNSTIAQDTSTRKEETQQLVTSVLVEHANSKEHFSSRLDRQRVRESMIYIISKFESKLETYYNKWFEVSFDGGYRESLEGIILFRDFSKTIHWKIWDQVHHWLDPDGEVSTLMSIRSALGPKKPWVAQLSMVSRSNGP